MRSYKPGLAHFHEAMRRTGAGPSQILHVAQSLWHDHVPAQSLGMKTAWVERPSRLGAIGLAPPADVKPTLHVRVAAAARGRDRRVTATSFPSGSS